MGLREPLFRSQRRKIPALGCDANGQYIKIIKPGTGDNDITLSGTVEGKKIKGTWAYPPATGIIGTFELTIDDDGNMHGFMLKTMDKGLKSNQPPDEFRAVKRKSARKANKWQGEE